MGIFRDESSKKQMKIKKTVEVNFLGIEKCSKLMLAGEYSSQEEILSVEPSKYLFFDNHSNGEDNDFEVFSTSTNSPTSESGSESFPAPLSVRSLPLMKSFHYSKFCGRRSSFHIPEGSSEFAFPSSVSEKRLKRRKQKNLRRSQKPYEFLTTGTPMLKYCRRKSPHWRHFEVDTDLEYLVWYSDTKSKRQTRIRLADIEDVVFGQVSPGFQKNPRSRLFHQSFSIKYKGKNYLDLICVTNRDCQMWYHSLKNVIKNIREGDKWRHMREINIPHKHEKSKNTIYPARDGKTWMKYLNDLHSSQDQIQELFKRSEELLESSGVLTMRKWLKKRIKQLDAWAEDAKTCEYLLLKQCDEIRVIRVEIKVLQFKVRCLLREKASKGTGLSNFIPFGSSFNTPESSITNSVVRRSSERAALNHLWWYKQMPQFKKSLVREMMVNDVIKEDLTEKTVTQVCSTFSVSTEEVKAIARYLDEKYKRSPMTKIITLERSAI